MRLQPSPVAHDCRARLPLQDPALQSSSLKWCCVSQMPQILAAFQQHMLTPSRQVTTGLVAASAAGLPEAAVASVGAAADAAATASAPAPAPAVGSVSAPGEVTTPAAETSAVDTAAAGAVTSAPASAAAGGVLAAAESEIAGAPAATPNEQPLRGATAADGPAAATAAARPASATAKRRKQRKGAKGSQSPLGMPATTPEAAPTSSAAAADTPVSAPEAAPKSQANGDAAGAAATQDSKCHPLGPNQRASVLLSRSFASKRCRLHDRLTAARKRDSLIAVDCRGRWQPTNALL